MPRLRGDNIPPVSDYAHWNEDAHYMWYEENKYDMEHWDEPIDEDDDYNPNAMEMYFEGMDGDIWEVFDTEEEARVLYEKLSPTAHTLTLGRWLKDKWRVEGMSTKYYNDALNRFYEWKRNKR